MTEHLPRLVFLTIFTLAWFAAASAERSEPAGGVDYGPPDAADGQPSDPRPSLQATPRVENPGAATPIIVRPATLADAIGLVAGRPVQVAGARVVGILGPGALVIDTGGRLRPVPGHRDRILVLVEDGAIRIPAELLLGSPVRIIGVARTLLGLQVTADAPWPVGLDRRQLERLEIRAAVLATSVQTAEGVELTDRP
jgi:hypothetical protein